MIPTETSLTDTMFWKNFATQKAAREAIREIVNTQPMKMPFESELISDLIFERHYFCSIRALRPSRFRKIPAYNNYSFEGDFSACAITPSISWHAVSWDKCLKPPGQKWDWIVRAMRDRVEPAKTRYRMEHPACEECDAEADDVHHDNPAFVEIAHSIRGMVTDKEIDHCLADWNWFAKENFQLPESHRITSIFDEVHDAAILKSLCKTCHYKTLKKS